MELLSRTCKILYDKDYLDSKMRLKKSLGIENILFDNYHDYKKSLNDFYNTIKDFLNVTITEESIRSFKNNNNLMDNPVIIKFQKILLYRLNLVIHNSNQNWSEYTVYTFTNTICGSIRALLHYGNLSVEILKNFILSSVSQLFLENDGIFDRISKIKCCYCQNYQNNVTYIGECICKECSNMLF